MWQIIKAEYEDTLITNFWKTLGVAIIIVFFSFGFLSLSMMVVYLFAGGIVISFMDANRYYIYQTLPVKPKELAFARLIMVGLNFAVLLIITIPLLALFQTEFANSILKLFNMVGALILIRIFVFSLFDITSGFLSKRKRKSLLQLFLFIAPIIVAYIYIATSFFRQPEFLIFMLTLTFCLVPIFVFLSIKTFLAKDVITVKEEL